MFVCLAHSIFHASLGPDCMAWWSRKEKQSAKGFQHDKLFCIQMLHLITSTCRSDVDRTSRDLNADHNWRPVGDWVGCNDLQRWDARATIGLTLTILFDENNRKRCVFFGCPSVVLSKKGLGWLHLDSRRFLRRHFRVGPQSLLSWNIS